MDLISYTKYIAALAAVIIILLVIAYIFKRMSQRKPSNGANSQDIFNGKSSSLFVQEVLPIDQKTKIVIVGRDNLRHVILIGENHSNLIETVSPNQISNEAPDFAASKNVGSISMGTAAAEQIVVERTPEPDFSNIKSEPISDEPKLSSTVQDNKADSEKQSPNKAQMEDDLQGKSDEIKDDKKPENSTIKDIKNKLQDAKDLAEPSKD